MIRGLPFWSSLAILIIALTALIAEPGFTVLLRNVSFDAFQRWHPRKYQPAPVRIIDIDEESLKRYGQWPWPRTKLASLVDTLREMGARVIVFSIVFAEHDRTSPAFLARQWPELDPEVLDLVKMLPDHDRIFASSLAKGGVVTGITLGGGGTSKRLPVLKSRFITAGGDPKEFLPSIDGAVTNLEILESAAAGNGSFSFISDYDGVIRHVPLFFKMKDKLYPSLSAEALRVFQGAMNIVVKSSSGEGDAEGPSGIVSVRIGNVPVQTDPQGEVWLHFSKPLPERYIPAWKILKKEVTPELVNGAIAFLGTSAEGLMDMKFSPLGNMIPGVEVHAQLVEQMIQESWLMRPNWDKAAVALFLAVMWLLFFFLLSWVGVLWSVLLGLAAVGGIVSASWYAFTEARLIVDPLFPSLVLIGIFLTCSVSRHILKEREQRWIQDAFSKYVSPNLVRHIMKNPDQLTLGGENRECTFVLTDLAGFTSFMEKTEPSSVVSLLNRYLDEMVRITFSYNGTLERFMGDAVAVMFSAPIVQPDHAERAVACAKAMDTFARDFAAARRAEGILFGETRIGVNTGVVLVGNLGGENMFDYRSLGDPINTAARLESVNKQLGTHVCVSGATVEKCPGFTGRPVGTLVLKGKSQGLATFEPLTIEEMESPLIQTYMEAYRLMENKDPKALAAFKSLVREWPDDPLANYHLKRLEQGETGNVVVMIAK